MKTGNMMTSQLLPALRRVGHLVAGIAYAAAAAGLLYGSYGR